MSESQRELLMIADWLDPSKNPATPSETWSDTANRLRRLAASLPALPAPPGGKFLKLLNECDQLLVAHHSIAIANGWEGPDCPVCSDTGKPNIFHRIAALKRSAATTPMLPTPLPEGFEDRIRNQAGNIVYSVFGFPASAVIGRKSPALVEAISAALLVAHRATTTPMLPANLTALLDRMTASDYMRCLNSMCGDVGWYAEGPTDDPEQVQCEFCYTEPRSLFNLKEAIKAIVTPPLPTEAPRRFPDFDSLLEMVGEIGAELDAEGLSLEAADRIYDRGFQDGRVNALQDMGEATEAPCSNPHCLDGWVDEAQGTQDGSETYVGQVPCEVCRVRCDAAEAPTWREGHRNQSICLNCGIRHDCPKIGDPPF